MGGKGGQELFVVSTRSNGQDRVNGLYPAGLTHCGSGLWGLRSVSVVWHTWPCGD